MLNLERRVKANLKNNSYNRLFKNITHVIDNYVNNNDIKENQQNELIQNADFLNFLNSSPGMHMILDFPGKGYFYISENVKELWGYTPQEFYDVGLTKTVTIFPESHVEILFTKIFPMMFEYFEKFGKSGDADDLKISFNTKVIKSDGTVGWFQHQIKILQTDESNIPITGYKLVTDISDFHKDENIYFSISKKNEKGIYKNLYSEEFHLEHNDHNISKREKEIIQLLGQGKSSKDISDLLSISQHTVNNHRKNILKKLDAKSAGEILQKAISRGII